MRYALSDAEWAASNPMLQNKPRGIPRLLCRFFEQLPPDQHAPDFAGAGADLVEFCITQQPAGGIIIDIAVAAEQLDGIERTLGRLLPGVKTGAGGILAGGLAAVAG